jgi:hypothetical protein
MALSASDRRAFFDRGIVRIPRAFSILDADRMVGSIWELLERKYQLHPNDPQTWTEQRPTGFQALTRAGTFNAIAGGLVSAALDDLLGAESWSPGKAWGVLLVSFPENGRKWGVPSSQWHLDFPARANGDGLPGVRVLAFIAPVESGGGGTVVAAGTHRLVEDLVATAKARDGHSATVRDLLAGTCSWLRALWSETPDEQVRTPLFMTEGVPIDGIDVRVEELTGEVGDVVLMHPWTFHAPAPNCSRRPRMMVSHSVYRNAARSS